MEAVAIATATNAAKTSSNCSNTNTNSNSSSSSSSGYGSATTTPLSHYETTPQHAATTAATEAVTPPPAPTSQPQPAAAQTVATVAPYAYSSESVLAATDTQQHQQQQQQQQQQRQYYQYTTSPYGYQPAAPAASLQTLYSQHDPYVGLNYAQHAAAALDYNSSNDLALRERLQHSSNNNYTNNAAHSPIEKLAAYANLTASSAQHAVAGNTPYKHSTDTSASTNVSSEIAASTPPTKPQAAATPFYATARAPVVASAASYYDQYKFKMPTTAVAAAADYTNYGCRVPPSTATSYQQQQQQYYAAVKSQLSQSEANYMAATTKSPLSPTAGSIARQQMNSFYGRTNLYYDKYDKFSSAAYPTTPNTATSNLTNLSAANSASYPTTHPTPPHYVTENALPSPESYRKTTVAPPPPASSWHWNMDYAAAATGNCRTLPPPPSAPIPTAAIPPSNANSSYLSPSGSASSSTRDIYYNSMANSVSSSKYDKYNAYAYHQQQQQATAAIPQRNMWSTAAHERLPHVSPHSTHPTHQPLPPPPYPPHPYATQTRQNCCTQLPYQHQAQPQQNCYYSRLPPQHVASNAYAQQHPHHMQPQMAPPHYGSNKYGSNMYTADYSQNKLKYPNDLIATSSYDAAPTYTGYNYAAAATTQRYQQATQQHHNIASDAAAAAAYYNDLNLQSTAYESYATTVQQQNQQQQQQQQQQQPQHSHHLQQQPPQQQQLHVQPRPQQQLTYHQQPSTTLHAKNPLLDYRKPSSLSLTAPTATPVMPSAADADFYMHESSNNAPTYHNFDSVSNVSLYESSGDSVADKLNAANKNLSLRDFLATWNDDEDDAAAAAAELNFAEPTATSANNQVTILQTETIPATPVTAHYLQDTPAPTQSPALENQHQQFKGAFNAVPKIQVGITVDSNMEAQYINLPDIVIDIEKSNNVTNVAAASPFEDFDVEKELDELQIKRSKLSNEQHATEQHNNATQYSTLNAATTEATNMQEVSSYQSLLSYDESHQVPLLSGTEKDSNNRDEAEQQQEASAMREDAVVSAATKDQLSKDLECDNSSLSNESTFEKEYETFINKLGSDVEAPSREKFRAASVIMSSASFTTEAEDLSTTHIKNAQPESDANEESDKTDSTSTVEQHKYSKFYKRKRKLIDEVAANVVKETSTTEHDPNSLKDSDVTAVAAETSPTSEQQNFPLAYTKTCRKRKMLTATCVRNANANKRSKHDAQRRNIVAKAKVCLTRRRKPKSLYYKMLHQSSLKKLQARCRLLQHVAKLRESHLPLIKRQSIKRFAAVNNRQRPSAFNPQTLKCLSVSTLNTEHFRQHFLSMLMGNKLQKKRVYNVAAAEADVAGNKNAAAAFITNKLDEENTISVPENFKSISVAEDINMAINVDKDLETDVPKSETQNTELPKTDMQEKTNEDETQNIYTAKIMFLKKIRHSEDAEDYDAENEDIPQNDQHVSAENLTLKDSDAKCHLAKNNETKIIAEKACENLGLVGTDINNDDIQNDKTLSNDFHKNTSELYEINANTEQNNVVNELKDDIKGLQNKCTESNDGIDNAIERNEKAENIFDNNNLNHEHEEKHATCIQNPQHENGTNHDVAEIEADKNEKIDIANIGTEATEDEVNNVENDSDDDDDDDDDDDADDDSSSSDNEESNVSDSDESSADEYKNNEKSADHIENTEENNANKAKNAIVLEANIEKESRTEHVHDTVSNLPRDLSKCIENDMKDKAEVLNSKENIEGSLTSDIQGHKSESDINENDQVNNNEANNDLNNVDNQSSENKIEYHANLLAKIDTDNRYHKNDNTNIEHNNANKTYDLEEMKSQQILMPNIDEKKHTLDIAKAQIRELQDTDESSCQEQASDKQTFSESPITSSESDPVKNMEKEFENSPIEKEERFLSDGPRTTEQENILTEEPRLSDTKNVKQLSTDNKFTNDANIEDLDFNDAVVDDFDTDHLDPEVAENKVLLNSSQLNRLVAYEDTSDDLDAEETENETKETQLRFGSDQELTTTDNVANDFDTEKTENQNNERLSSCIERKDATIANVQQLKSQNIQSDALDETSNSSSSSSSSSESDSSSSSDATTTSNSSTSTSSTTKTTTTSEESVDDFNEMIALERELSTHYEPVKTYDETQQVDEMEQKINQDAKSYDFSKTKIITKSDIASLKKVLEGAEEEEEVDDDDVDEKQEETTKVTAEELSHKVKVKENYLETMEIKNSAILNEAAAVEDLSHKVRVIENYLEKMEKSTILNETALKDELSHRNEVIENCLEKTEIGTAATTEDLNHKVAVIEKYLEKMENSALCTEAAIATAPAKELNQKDDLIENSAALTEAAAEELNHKVAVIENYLEKMENSTILTKAATEDELNHKVEVIENYLEKLEKQNSTPKIAAAEELNQKVDVIENYLEKMENSTVLTEAAADDLNHKVAVIENYLEKMENSVVSLTEDETLSAVIEKPITRNEVEEMLLAAFESAVKEADVLERLEGGVQLMLPCTSMEISHNHTDQYQNALLANEEMNQVVNLTIPKLSDLCKNALNSSCKRSESMKYSLVDQDQHHANVDHYTDEGDCQQEPEQAAAAAAETRELSVEEALAEMYRQAGVASDPEDFDTDDNDKQAQEVLLINLEEILVSDSDNLYVLQCDINENILGVIATQTVDRSNNVNDNDENDEVADANDVEVNAIELIELFNASDAIDETNPTTTTKTTNEDNTNANALINDVEISQNLHIKYEPNTELVSANISTTTTNTTKILPPASGDDNVADDANHHVDVNDFYDDNDFDLPTIHHEEIVPDNYKNYHKEKFLKYLHAKYVQRNITKFYHSNRIIKKYKKRLVQKLLNAIAERKRYGQ